MAPRLIPALIALFVAVAACGDDRVHVCDGTDQVRLAVRYRPGFALSPGERVLYDHGQSWLFVDGACTYQVKIGGRWDDALTGAADDAVLVNALELGEHEARAGAYTGEIADGATLELAFAGARVTCAGGCTGGDVPEWLTTVNARAASLLRDLYDLGSSQALPQRVLVIAQPVPPTPSFVWPAALDPSSIAVPPEDADTAPTTLVSGDDGLALRDLRRDVRDATPAPAAAYVTTDLAVPPSYAVFLRDALPYEDASAQVPDPVE